ncbi:MAG: hypothetical protein HQK52_21365 [Oligoflexia bacterium]|nr:hypothetical protein [Oligoflexia bacterium]
MMDDLRTSEGNGGVECLLKVYSTMAVDSITGICLGILDLRIINDDVTQTDDVLSKAKDLWIFTFEQSINKINMILDKDTAKLLARCIYVADGEADDMSIYSYILNQGSNLVIRSQHNRNIDHESYAKLNDCENTAIKHGSAYEVEVTCKEKGRVEKRIAIVQKYVVRDIVILPSDYTKKFLSPLKLNFVIANYEKKWVTEELYKCVKSGGKVEERQMTKTEHLYPMISMMFVIGWRLLTIRDMSRVDEDKKAVTVKDALSYIAREGGFFGSYPNPGWIVLWKGWFKFSLMVHGFEFARQLQKKHK